MLTREMYSWIVAVDGKPTDIRTDVGLAIHQGKVRASNTDAPVTLHYGHVTATTLHVDGKMEVQIAAKPSDNTLMATIHK